MPGKSKIPWSTGLFDCFDDVDSCCQTLFFPFVTFGQITDIIDEGSPGCCVSGTIYLMILSVLPGFQTGYSYYYRSELRDKYSLEESPCSDCCVHLFCESCALCQEYRELQNRGFDMEKGWSGKNIQVQMSGGQQAPVEPPVVQQPMDLADKHDGETADDDF